MRRFFMVGLLIFSGLLALWGLLQSPVSVSDVFTHPIASLWGTRRQLDMELIEISEHMEPASRRLLKPFGEVRLIRTLTTKTPLSDVPVSSSSAAVQPSTLR